MAEHISRKEGYSIGYGAFMLSRFGGYNHRLKTLTHPVLKWLTAKTGETAIFCVLKGDRRVCIDCVIGEFPLGSGEESIRVEKLPGASTGAVLIANLPEDRMREFSGKHREVVAAMCEDSGELENTLSEIRRLGYGENCSGEGEKTLRGFAVPVFKCGECLGAIGMPYRGERKPSHLKYLRMAAREIARRLEFAEL